jgi:hypothetical protein
MSADNVYIWLRRKGAPGTLTVQIWDDSSNPNALVTDATQTTTISTVTDYESRWMVFDLSAAGNLTASTVYWVVVFGGANDDATNHWEVGVSTATDTSKKASAGASWSAAGFTMYSRVTDTDTGRTLLPFEMSGALFMVDVLDSGGNSTLYMNGEMGKATSGTSTTLVDTDEGFDTSWAADQWNGYWIKIVTGTGKGQSRLISDTSATGTITVSSAWDINPSTDSEYVIYSGPAWQSFAAGTTGLGAVKDVAVMNNIAYFAQGSGDNVRRIRFNSGGSPPALQYADDSTNKADVLHSFQDAVDGPVMWRGENDTVDISRANAAAWATDLSFGTAILVGDTTSDINNIFDYNKGVYIFKEDGIYVVVNDRAEKLGNKLGFIKSSNTGEAVVSDGTFLFFSQRRHF